MWRWMRALVGEIRAEVQLNREAWAELERHRARTAELARVDRDLGEMRHPDDTAHSGW